ncbi:MAG TPA: protein translocase subunit SecF, partial [Gemmatimonadales bacterium]|nr:protein translocase subunit SecF [Gemmatimonadales bacterium]
MRLFHNASYDFISVERWAWSITAAIILPGLIMLGVRGLNYSVEFTGGTLIQVGTDAPADFGKVRSALDGAGIHGAELQAFGTSGQEFIIRARVGESTGEVDANNTQLTIATAESALTSVMGAGHYKIEHTYAIGPKVGAELRGQALWLIFLSFFVVLLYLAVRFEWRFGVAAVLATAHDIVATIAFISILHLEVSLVVVAAVLSMVGYSLNDTIIIFDRVRENLHKYKRSDLYGILNLSVNETLPRSILTHGTSLATLLALAVFGGEVIRPFALVMFFGVFTGTFSSI